MNRKIQRRVRDTVQKILHDPSRSKKAVIGRRQFLGSGMAVATVVCFPIFLNSRTTTLSWWAKEPEIVPIVNVHNPLHTMDFSKIEARVLAYLKDKKMVQHGVWRQLAYNTRGEVFVDGISI